MDYRYLRAFIITANHLNFSKAAKELGIAQSAVSRQIKLLEDDLGEQLIVRSSKKVLLTEKGRELHQLAQNFDIMSHGIFNKEDKAPLRIGLLHGLLEDWLTPRVATYVKEKKRGVSIKVDGQDELMRGIENGQFDLIFSTTTVQSELLSSLKLFEERLILIAKNTINKKELHLHPWVVYSTADHLFHMGHKRPETIVQVESMTSIVTLVKAGVGIAIIPDHCLRPGHKLFTLEIDDVKNPGIFMTSLNYKSYPAKIKEFIDSINKSESNIDRN